MDPSRCIALPFQHLWIFKIQSYERNMTRSNSIACFYFSIFEMQSVEPLDGKEHTTRLVRQVQSSICSLCICVCIADVYQLQSKCSDGYYNRGSVPSEMHGIFWDLFPTTVQLKNAVRHSPHFCSWTRLCHYQTIKVPITIVTTERKL